ncbi:MAG: DUF1849 family protein [Pseudomonadota bacterium]
MSILRIKIVALALGLALQASTAWAAEIASHRGFYGLKLSSARQGGAFIDARGGLDMTIEKTCDGWLLSQDLAMELATAQGGEVRQVIRYSGWESLDGKNYRFVSRTQTGQDRKESRGDAHVIASDLSGEAVFQRPKAKTVPLPPGTRFPIAHAIWLIDRALAGEHQAPSAVFDGTDGEGPQNVTAFIGRKVAAKEHGRGTLGALAEQAGWTMRLAFFAEDSKEASPEYEMEIFQLANGVAPRMVLDYRDFSVVLEIQKIEPIPPPACP